jgi:phosphoribosylcarboxyaminoimidazole (NCAIR) mutase
MPPADGRIPRKGFSLTFRVATSGSRSGQRLSTHLPETFDEPEVGAPGLGAPGAVHDRWPGSLEPGVPERLEPCRAGSPWFEVCALHARGTKVNQGTPPSHADHRHLGSSTHRQPLASPRRPGYDGGHVDDGVTRHTSACGTVVHGRGSLLTTTLLAPRSHWGSVSRDDRTAGGRRPWESGVRLGDDAPLRPRQLEAQGVAVRRPGRCRPTGRRPSFSGLDQRTEQRLVGVEVFIRGGRHGPRRCPGVVGPAQTTRPVLGSPMETTISGGLDSLLSDVSRCRAGDPVGVAPRSEGRAVNAAILATQILRVARVPKFDEAVRTHREAKAAELSWRTRTPPPSGVPHLSRGAACPAAAHRGRGGRIQVLHVPRGCGDPVAFPVPELFGPFQSVNKRWRRVRVRALQHEGRPAVSVGVRTVQSTAIRGRGDRESPGRRWVAVQAPRRPVGPPGKTRGSNNPSAILRESWTMPPAGVSIDNDRAAARGSRVPASRSP